MINWDRVTELVNEIDAEDFQEIVTLFLEEVEDAMEEIQDIEAPSDLRDKIHFLKGSMLNLGFEDVGRFCQAAEANLPATPVDLALLATKYQASKVEFLENIPKA
ncbi:MAG: Hpt domain-containing protein [Halocynthiibacter sp.]